MPGPLEGVRVLEFTQIIAGPLGCMLLADQGAEVLKVEPLGGEPWRLQNQFRPLESKSYQSLNRGKLPIAMDLTKFEAQAAVHRIVKSCDVVVSNYRPDVPARLGIDYATLSALKPDLVYVDSTAFGRRGPWANKPGYDIVAQGASGLTASAGRFDERGTPVLSGGTATADFSTGYAIAWGACAALFRRERTGEGQLVETSLLANALMFQVGSFMSLPAADEALRAPLLRELDAARAGGATYTELAEIRRKAMAGRQSGNIYYRNYLTSDGAIAIGNLSGSLRQKMRESLGIEYDPRDHDPAYDPRDPRMVQFGEELTERIETVIRAESTEHWVSHFERAGVPVSPLMFTEELAHHPQVVENEYIVEVAHDLSGAQWTVAPPHKMSVSPPTVAAGSPPLGRDTDRILTAAGYTSDEIVRLRELKAVG